MYSYYVRWRTDCYPCSVCRQVAADLGLPIVSGEQVWIEGCRRAAEHVDFEAGCDRQAFIDLLPPEVRKRVANF